MDLLVVGNVSIDTIEIDDKQAETIGGAAYYVALAASLTGCNTILAALVGEDFPLEKIPKVKRLSLDYLKVVPGHTTRFKLQYDHAKILRMITSDFGIRPIEPNDITPLPLHINAMHITSKAPVMPEKFLTISNEKTVFSTDVSLSSLEKKKASILLFLSRAKYIFLNTDEHHVIGNWLYSNEYPDLTIIVTQAEDGVRAYSKNNVILELPAYKTEVVDPTGAGDVLAGCSMGMLCQNNELATAVAFGSAMASICVEGWGSSSISNISELEIKKRAEWIVARAKYYAE